MAIDTTKLPQAGDVWVHYKGGLYQVVTLARFKGGLEVAVVYRSITDGSTWVRSLSEWSDDVGGYTRFVRVKP